MHINLVLKNEIVEIIQWIYFVSQVNSMMVQLNKSFSNGDSPANSDFRSLGFVLSGGTDT